MVFAEFRNLFDKIIVPDKVGVEDFVDRLTLVTAVLFGLASLLVCTKQYIMSALTCYIPVGPSGELFRDFVNSYCWVHGTIPLKPNEPFPKSEEMWDEYDRIRRINRFRLEDFADRLHLVTVVLFSLAASIVGLKQYVFNPLSCYIAIGPSGEEFADYVHSYCWVHGTIPLKAGEPLPDTPAEWEQYDRLRRFNLYFSLLSMGAFVLGLQCILFYIPHLAWQALCSNQAGGDVFQLVKAAADAATSERSAREKQVKRVAEFLTDMIISPRVCLQHYGRRNVNRRIYQKCDSCSTPRRLGTCLIILYMIFKVITLINAILQLYLIQRFLGFYSEGSTGSRSMNLAKFGDSDRAVTVSDANEDWSGLGFGLTVANHLRTGRDWPETTLFPRVAYCRVRGIRLVGVENAYTAQCALPVNMLNEKIYIFFWFWLVVLISASVASLVLWLIRVVFTPRRKHFIKRFLRIKIAMVRNKPRTISRADIDDFVDDYLRRDGVFLIRMLALNAGEVITAEIVTELYNDYLEQHSPPSSFEANDRAPIATKELV
ncbi:Innexin unc-7 [Clonorchis sinensis]|uniref:Innexin n=1 Tax=Clonorchis sinensis TaxID=79923 RepID=A0A8T1M0P5_CLOSI|nr:Innexin unc-7 [Clonorchis sinensis]